MENEKSILFVLSGLLFFILMSSIASGDINVMLFEKYIMEFDVERDVKGEEVVKRLLTLPTVNNLKINSPCL